MIVLGMFPVVNPPLDDLQGLINSEIERWAHVVREAGLGGRIERERDQVGDECAVDARRQQRAGRGHQPARSAGAAKAKDGRAAAPCPCCGGRMSRPPVQRSSVSMVEVGDWEGPFNSHPNGRRYVGATRLLSLLRHSRSIANPGICHLASSPGKQAATLGPCARR